MRVVLIHNASAGSEDHARPRLLSHLREAGHQVVAVLDDPEQLKEGFPSPDVELLVAAGGDGTVGRVVTLAARSSLPVAIFPVGTANNMARALGISVHDDVARWIQQWQQSTHAAIDLATVSSESEEKVCVEAVGFGLFPQVMAQAEQMASSDGSQDELRRDLALFRAAAQLAQPAFYELRADNVDLSGEYLLVEVLNFPFIGPNVRLSLPCAPDDGALQLCLVREGERAQLLSLLDDALSGNSSGATLSGRPIRRFEVVSPRGVLCHVDDELWLGSRRRDDGLGTVAVSLTQATVHVLAPAT